VATAKKQAPEPANRANELLSLIKRAEGGDRSTLPELRRILSEPSAVDLLGGDLARQAEEAFVNNAAGKNLVFREALTRKLELLRAELCGPDPTPVERLLVERVVACWLQVQDADARYAQALGEAPVAHGDYQQRRMDRAHRRYLSALRTLALVRRLAVPVLQVNVARKQVNVGSASFSSAPPAGGPD
jgi:hypothetical protein